MNASRKAGTTLKGLTILVTRPRAQADKLSREITEHGGKPLICPALEITEVKNPDVPRRTLKRLPEFDLCIFVSRNAVEFALSLHAGMIPTLSTMETFAVGEATGQRLISAGVKQPLWPVAEYSSEGLLGLAELQSERIDSRRALVVRGEGGRETLADGLRERGAMVEYVEVYRRVRTLPNLGTLQKSPPDIIIATSAGVLDSLVETFIDAASLLSKPLVVPGQRLRVHAMRCGFCGPIVSAATAREGDLVAATLAGGDGQTCR